VFGGHSQIDVTEENFQKGSSVPYRKSNSWPAANNYDKGKGTCSRFYLIARCAFPSLDSWKDFYSKV